MAWALGKSGMGRVWRLRVWAPPHVSLTVRQLHPTTTPAAPPHRERLSFHLHHQQTQLNRERCVRRQRSVGGHGTHAPAPAGVVAGRMPAGGCGRPCHPASRSSSRSNSRAIRAAALADQVGLQRMQGDMRCLCCNRYGFVPVPRRALQRTPSLPAPASLCCLQAPPVWTRHMQKLLPGAVSCTLAVAARLVVLPGSCLSCPCQLTSGQQVWQRKLPQGGVLLCLACAVLCGIVSSRVRPRPLTNTGC